MKKEFKISKLLNYLQQHWFKLAFVSILLYLFIQKDFRFSVNLNSPNNPAPLEVNPPASSAKKAQKKEIFTEIKKEPSKILDKFEMPSPFRSKKRYDAMLDLDRLSPEMKHAYLKRFARVVINERHKYGIPSSILLAIGLLQSQAGQSELAKRSNNHFDLPCSQNWMGASVSYNGACYRQYENAWTSFRDHSNYIVNSPNFAPLLTLDATDYKAWAKGLQQVNYSNQSHFAKNIINIIEKYGLDELDRR